MNMMLAGMLPLFWLKKISVSSASAAEPAPTASRAPDITANNRDLRNRMM